LFQESVRTGQPASTLLQLLGNKHFKKYVTIIRNKLVKQKIIQYKLYKIKIITLEQILKY